MYLSFDNVYSDKSSFRIPTRISLGLSTSSKREHQIHSPLFLCDIVSYSLTSLLLSHFILDLRSIHFSEDDTSGSTHQVTSVRFVSNIEGNLGATLDISWATGEERDIDEEEDNDIVYSDDPLPVGLIDIRRDDEERLEAEQLKQARRGRIGP